jgi:hypothetical protein
VKIYHQFKLDHQLWSYHTGFKDATAWNRIDSFYLPIDKKGKKKKKWESFIVFLSHQFFLSGCDLDSRGKLYLLLSTKDSADAMYNHGKGRYNKFKKGKCRSTRESSLTILWVHDHSVGLISLDSSSHSY